MNIKTSLQEFQAQTLRKDNGDTATDSVWTAVSDGNGVSMIQISRKQD